MKIYRISTQRRKKVFTMKNNPSISIHVFLDPMGRILEIENKNNQRFPFEVGQILQRNVETWADNHGWLIDGKDVGPEEKVMGIRTKDIPQGYPLRYVYPNKFR